MVKKRGLGKGLDALLGTAAVASDSNGNNDTLKTLPVDLLQRGQFQPRKDFNQEALQELADSISAQGIVQPIVVRELPGSRKYEIIAGERRWRAAQLAGLQDVPVVIKDVPDQTVMCIALIENIQRQDLNPLEEAQALSRLIHEFDMTHELVAESVGRSRSSVTNLLRLLDLDESVKELLANGQLEMGHARALLGLDKNAQLQTAKTVARKGLSVRETEALVKRLLEGGKSKTKASKLPKQDANIRRLQSDLSEKLGAEVSIKTSGKGKGSLIIQYHSLDELDGILSRIK